MRALYQPPWRDDNHTMAELSVSEGSHQRRALYLRSERDEATLTWPRRRGAGPARGRVRGRAGCSAAPRWTAQGGDRHGTTRLFSVLDERGAGGPAAGGRPGPRRRDLHVAVHAEDHRAGGLRLRLDARRRGRGRRLRQAGHDRRQPGGRGALRQGDLLGVGRRPPRGAPCGLRRRPPSPLGRGARRQQDLGLRRGAGPGAPEARPHPRLLRQGQRRGPGPAHVLRSPGSDADHRPLQPEGPRRQDGARRVQQRRQVHPDALADRQSRVRLRCSGEAAAQPHDHIVHPMDVPLPVDIILSADDGFLFVDTFMDGTCRVYDVSDPHQPKLVHTQKIGSQVNMVSETWDGKRVYFTSSLLANWDKTGKDNEQFLKAYGWDGKQLTALFAVDFLKEKLGRPHIMHFGQERFYKNQIYAGETGRLAAAR